MHSSIGDLVTHSLTHSLVMGVMDMEIDKLVNEVDDMEVGDVYDALHWGTKFSIQILVFIESLQK